MISKAKEKGVKKMINVKTLATVERERQTERELHFSKQKWGFVCDEYK